MSCPLSQQILIWKLILHWIFLFSTEAISAQPQGLKLRKRSSKCVCNSGQHLYLKNQQMKPGSKWYCSFFYTLHHRKQFHFSYKWTKLYPSFLWLMYELWGLLFIFKGGNSRLSSVSEPRVSWTAGLHFLLWIPKYFFFMYFFQHCDMVLTL